MGCRRQARRAGEMPGSNALWGRCGMAEGEDGLVGSQEKVVSRTMREELHLLIDLALVALEDEGQFPISGSGRERMRENRLWMDR